MFDVALTLPRQIRILLLLFTIVGGRNAIAQVAAADSGALETQFGVNTIHLWSSDSSIQSTLTVFRPQAG